MISSLNYFCDSRLLELLAREAMEVNMAAPEFLEIANCVNAVEAEQVRGMLEQEGIAAFVDGANANTALSFVGSALGGVRVFVRASEANRALAIFDMHGDGDDSRGAWFCGDCQEEVDGGFNVCWSCGGSRDTVEQPIPSDVKDKIGGSASKPHGVGVSEARDIFGYDPSNPYASPRSTSDDPTPEHQTAEINPEAEAIVQRAWRASIIGIVLFPFVTHLYSMYLLISAAAISTHFSPEGNRMFYQAIAVNVAIGFMGGILLTAMFR